MSAATLWNPTVFFADTSDGALDRSRIFDRVVREFGCRPVWYVGLKNRAEGTAQGAEMRADLAQASLAIVRIGPPTNEDNLALAYLDNEIERRNMACVIILSKALTGVKTAERPTKMLDAGNATSADFETQLRSILADFLKGAAN